MRKVAVLIALSCVAGLVSSGTVEAQGMQGGKGHGMSMPMFGSKEEAVAMVKKGAAFIKANGKEKGYVEITDGTRFKDRDLYLVVYGLDGMVRAHGQNNRMVHKNLIDLRDIDGKPFIRETVTRARTEPTFWMKHKFTDPMTKSLHPMEMYCERLEDSVICSGHFMR